MFEIDRTYEYELVRRTSRLSGSEYNKMHKSQTKKKQTCCVHGRQYRETIKQSVAEKIIPEQQKLLMLVTVCAICGWNENQLFTESIYGGACRHLFK